MIDPKEYRQICDNPEPEFEALLERLIKLQPSFNQHRDKFKYNFALMARGILCDVFEEYRICKDMAESYPEENYLWRYHGVRIALLKVIRNCRERLDALDAGTF